MRERAISNKLIEIERERGGHKEREKVAVRERAISKKELERER